MIETRLATPEVELNLAISSGEQPPLLFLHGVTRCWQSVLPIAPFLQTRWRVCGLDFRGHGASCRAGQYRVVDYLRDGQAALEQLAEPTVVYGHSLGAMVALGLAATRPELVRGIVLEDPPFETMGARLGQTFWLSFFRNLREFAGSTLPLGELAGRLANMPIETPGEAQLRLGDIRDAAQLRFTAKCLSHLDRSVLETIVRGEWLTEFDATKLCAAVRCPVLVLQADTAAGGMLTDDDVQTHMRHIRDATVVKLVRMGHVIHWTDQALVARLVLPFLESLS